MFDIAWSEYLIIAVVALVLLGPKELPVVLKTLGRWVAKARQLTANFESQVYALGEHPDLLEKNSLTETSDSSVVLPPSITYQRVFFKQHEDKRVSPNLLKLKMPAPKPWL